MRRRAAERGSSTGGGVCDCVVLLVLVQVVQGVNEHAQTCRLVAPNVAAAPGAACGLTNLIHDGCSCSLFTLSSVAVRVLFTLGWMYVHSSVNKPGANGRVSYNTLTHSRLYCTDREKK